MIQKILVQFTYGAVCCFLEQGTLLTLLQSTYIGILIGECAATPVVVFA